MTLAFRKNIVREIIRRASSPAPKLSKFQLDVLMLLVLLTGHEARLRLVPRGPPPTNAMNCDFVSRRGSNGKSLNGADLKVYRENSMPQPTGLHIRRYRYRAWPGVARRGFGLLQVSAQKGRELQGDSYGFRFSGPQSRSRFVSKASGLIDQGSAWLGCCSPPARFVSHLARLFATSELRAATDGLLRALPAKCPDGESMAARNQLMSK